MGKQVTKSRLDRSDFKEKYYSEKFYFEKLKGFRIRLSIVASSSFLILLYLVVIINVYEKEFSQFFSRGNFLTFASLMLVLIILREIITGVLLERRIKRGEKVSDIFRYINTFIEISIPTVGIYIFATLSSPVYALLSPIVFFYFIFLLLSTLELDFFLCLFTGFLAGGEYTGTVFYFINSISLSADFPLLSHPIYYVGKGLILVLCGVIAGIVALQIKKRIIDSYKVQEERNRIEHLFGQQVSKEIVDEVMKSKIEVESIQRVVCIMFLDVRDFSKYASDKKPEDIIRYQNDLFGFMIEIVNENHGIINQILGDGFMATFGAPVSYPNDCQNAVNAALKIIDVLEKKCNTGRLPATRVGIGIHTGEAVTGNVGTSIRKQYSITGNVVILTSRIEQLNKEFGSQLLISRDVINSIDSQSVHASSLGGVLVKGSTEPIEVFKLA